MRDFLFVDDLAQSVIYALENKLSEHLYNVGSGKEITIKDSNINIFLCMLSDWWLLSHTSWSPNEIIK